MFCGFSQTDYKVGLSEYWMTSFPGKKCKKKKAVWGQEVKAAAWRR